MATTTDFVNYVYQNLTWLKPNGANDTDAPEIVIEAGSTPVELSTGDFLHLYAAGTPGWVANGNYTVSAPSWHSPPSLLSLFIHSHITPSLFLFSYLFRVAG